MEDQYIYTDEIGGRSTSAPNPWYDQLKSKIEEDGRREVKIKKLAN